MMNVAALTVTAEAAIAMSLMKITVYGNGIY
jgi:hypothetical protein